MLITGNKVFTTTTTTITTTATAAATAAAYCLFGCMQSCRHMNQTQLYTYTLPHYGANRTETCKCQTNRTQQHNIYRYTFTDMVYCVRWL